MSCDRYRAALADVAAGALGPPGLEKHLAECSGCGAAFENERRILGRIDAELQAALSVPESAGFLAGARQRAAEKGNARRPWLLQWLVPVAVGAVMLALGIRVGRRDPAPSPDPAPAAPPAIVEAATPAPPREEPLPETAPKTTRVAPRAAARTPRPVEPEVLLPPGEEQLYARFARDIRERRVDRQSLLATGFDPGEFKEVEIPPVEIKPVVIQPIPRSQP